MPIIPLSVHKTRQDANTRAHWVFNEATGTTVRDMTGNGRTLTFAAPTASPTWVTTGRLLNAISLDGGDDFATAAATAQLFPATITVGVWLNMTGTGNYPMVVGSIVPVTNDKGYDLRFNAGTTQPEWAIGTPAGAVAVTDPGTIGTDSWHWIVGTVDGANLILYRDGISVASTATTATVIDPATTLWIGRRSEGRFWNGKLDDVFVRNGAMTAAQIAAEYQLLTRVTCYA